MTSSRDRAQWKPLELADPELGPAAAMASATATADWLPSLARPAEDHAAQSRELAYQQGYAAALAAERGRMESDAKRALSAVARVAEQMATLQTDFARDRERDLHTLAVAIARQVVQHELTISPERLTALVHAAIELLPHDPRIEVRLHPADLAALGAALDGLVPAGRGLELTWTPDASLERGGFVVETPQRIVDGRADVALRELWERLGHD